MGIFKKEKVYTTQKDVGQIINQFVTYLQQKGFKHSIGRKTVRQ
jgi:hypothetical protein